MTKLSWAQQAERGLLGLFVVLLVWLPLPLGSNRHWAAALFVALVWLLLAACGLLRLATRPTPGQVARTSWGSHVVLALLVMFTAWTSLQLTDRGYTEDPHETRLYVLRFVRRYFQRYSSWVTPARRCAICHKTPAGSTT